jgi:hypothetical protein
LVILVGPDCWELDCWEFHWWDWTEWIGGTGGDRWDWGNLNNISRLVDEWVCNDGGYDLVCVTN